MKEQNKKIESAMKLLTLEEYDIYRKARSYTWYNHDHDFDPPEKTERDFAIPLGIINGIALENNKLETNRNRKFECDLERIKDMMQSIGDFVMLFDRLNMERKLLKSKSKK